MAGSEGSGARIGSLFALSLGPFLVMVDLMITVIVSGGVKIGFGAPGKGFPSILGIGGTLLWLLGIGLVLYLKKRRKEKASSRSTPVFLKGRKGFRCTSCGIFLDCKGVDYHERKRCDCGALYEVFQEGPWDEQNGFTGSEDSGGAKMRKGNARSRRKLPRPPSR
ncbi:MAG: hypothetical protein ACMUHB_03005 [Thermoplasmatota archaeon]